MALNLRRLVPVEPDRRDVRELTLSRSGIAAPDVEILDPHEESPSRCPREKPCQQSGSQVSDVQVGAWGGSESARSNA